MSHSGSDWNGSEMEDSRTECRHCGEEVDIESTDIFKSVSDQFWHRDCFAEYCYQKRELVATPEGSFKIKPVIIKEIEDGKEKVIDSFWRADCPVCYRTHETEEKTEEIRTEFIDEVTSCCGTEWLPPADWIEDCDICGTDHRESRGCKPISRREPFPDPETHHFDCAECEWSGDGDAFDNPNGECPGCGTTAVRAVELATDGGEVRDPESGQGDHCTSGTDQMSRFRVEGKEKDGLRVSFRVQTVVPWEDLGKFLADHWTERSQDTGSEQTEVEN